MRQAELARKYARYVLAIGATSHQYRAETLARASLLGQCRLQLVGRDRAARDQHLPEWSRRSGLRGRDHGE
jgi:hypothetical protein